MSDELRLIPETPVSRFENHVQTVLQGLIVLLVGWLGYTTNNLQVEVAKLRTEQAITSVEIARLRDSGADRYTSTQARAEFNQIMLEIRSLDKRTTKLELVTNKD